MQMKNTSKFLPELDKGDNSLISTSNPTNFENGEDGKWPLDCKSCRCRIPESRPNTLVNAKRLICTDDKEAFLCNDCHMAVPGDYVNGAVEKDEFLQLSKTLHKNKKKDKHYCDKCRFTSKDLEQYKKHILQHEEIKFICSYCSFVSYTKGEFQRHLVKHTGTFPYKCEYCDYGAIRNDYVVKHTRRVHGIANKKQHSGACGKEEQSSKCLTVPLNAEHFIEDNDSFQKDLLNSSSNAGVDEEPFEICTVVSVCYIDSDETVQNVNFDKVAPCCDSIGMHVCHDGSVEVELSPESNMLQPGLPITVIAPPQLEVLPNSFVQIMEVKMVDGIQKLVLKLFHSMEKHSECTVGRLEESIISDINQKEFLTKYSNQTKPLVATYASMEKININPGYPKSKPDFLKNSSVRSSFSSHDAVEQLSVPVPMHDSNGEGKVLANRDLQIKSKLFFSDHDLMANGSNENVDLKTPPCISVRNPIEMEMACSKKSPNVALCTSVCDSKAASDQCHLTEISYGTNCSFIGGRKLPLISDHVDTQACLEVSESGYSSKALPSQNCNKDSSLHTAFAQGHENSPIFESYKPHNLHCVSNVTEGPFILSVFSLSSGVENIPEGINWDDVSAFTTDSAASSQSDISPMFDKEDCKIPLTLLGEKVPVITMSSNHIDLDAADANRKNSAPDKNCEPTNLGTATDHLKKRAKFSQIHMEAASETICNTAVMSAKLESGEGIFLSPDTIPDMPSLKQNCKTEQLQSDAFHLQKNCKILELTEKSKDWAESDDKQNDSDRLLKTEHLNCNPDNVDSHFQKSWLKKYSNVSCATEDDNHPLACPNILFEVGCLPVHDMAKKGCLKRTQISKCADIHQKSKGMQALIHLPKKGKKSCTPKREAGISATHAPREERNSPNRTPKKKVCFPKKRKSHIAETVVPENFHTASPVFIPKGTVLTVINSSASKAASKNGNCSKRSKNIAHCNETFLPRPVLFHNSPVKSHGKKQSKINHTINNRVNQDGHDSHLQRGILKGSQLTKKVKKGHLNNCIQKKLKFGGGNSKQEPNSKKQPKLNIRRNNVLSECGLENNLQKNVLKRQRLTKEEKEENFKDCVQNKKSKFGCRNSKQVIHSKKHLKLNVKRNILINEQGLESHLQKAVMKTPLLTKKRKEKHLKDCFKNKKTKSGCRNSKQDPNSKKQHKLNIRRNNRLVNQESLDAHFKKATLKRSRLKEKEDPKGCVKKKKIKVQAEHSIQNESKYAIIQERHLQLIPVLNNQRIKCPRLNQPVVVMNHPDVDSLEIVNIMDTIKKYKGRVLRVFLSERTMQCLCVKQQLKRLTCTNVVSTAERVQPILQMKQSTTHKVSEQTVDVIADESQQNAVIFQINERGYQPPNTWMSPGLPPPTESTASWSSCSLPEMSHS
ncbi:zinc finger protein 518B [Lissotriton helveticus]